MVKAQRTKPEVFFPLDQIIGPMVMGGGERCKIMRENKSQNIHVRIDSELQTILLTAADLWNMPVSSVVRGLLRAALDSEGVPQDVVVDYLSEEAVAHINTPQRVAMTMRGKRGKGETTHDQRGI